MYLFRKALHHERDKCPDSGPLNTTSNVSGRTIVELMKWFVVAVRCHAIQHDNRYRKRTLSSYKMICHLYQRSFVLYVCVTWRNIWRLSCDSVRLTSGMQCHQTTGRIVRMSNQSGRLEFSGTWSVQFQINSCRCIQQISRNMNYFLAAIVWSYGKKYNSILISLQLVWEFVKSNSCADQKNIPFGDYRLGLIRSK